MCSEVLNYDTEAVVVNLLVMVSTWILCMCGVANKMPSQEGLFSRVPRW